MDTAQREDIAALKRLTDEQRMDNITFNRLIFLLTDFTRDVLLTDRDIATLTVRQQVAIQCVVPARLFLQQQIGVNELEKYRVAAWQLYDQWNGASKNLVRIAICCMYDKQTAAFDNYGAEAVLETFLACLFDLDRLYCSHFAQYAISKLPNNPS